MESKGILVTSVTYGLAYLRSLPKYENVRVNIEITDDVRDDEDVDDAVRRVASKVDSLVQSRIEAIDAEATAVE